MTQMKNKIYPTLKTAYSEEMNKECPWDTYPRPMMVRDSYFSLCGEWNFEVSKKNEIPSVYSEKILVPFPVESALSGIERRVEANSFLCYRKNFELPKGFVNERVILHFGAIDQVCRVYLNGKLIGENEGGYIPFSFDITDFLSSETNELTVIASDTLSKKYPYGKQKRKRGGMWYTPVSGIWQAVWLESLPINPIVSIKVEQNAKNAKILVNSKAELKRLTLKEDGTVYEFSGDTIVIEPKEPKLWSPEHPYLYEFVLETETDKIESYFALREISVMEIDGTSRMCLNGEPYFFSGLLDQGYYPDGIFLPATVRGYEADIMLAKKLGFNTLRKHIKIEPLIFYHLCDKLGMIVFQDMVNNSGYSFFFDTALPTVGFKKAFSSLRNRDRETREFFLSQMEKTADLLFNSPSVCLYTIFNEGWGQFEPDEAYRRLKKLDSSRFIDTTSGWFHGKKSDVDSKHIYFRVPTIKANDGRPVFLSEFGGFSLRLEGHLFGEKNYGYSMYEDKTTFSDAVYHLYTDGLVPLIEDGLCATVYTQLSDVEDETNGLITYDREEIKVDVGKMKAANKALFDEFQKITNQK